MNSISTHLPILQVLVPLLTASVTALLHQHKLAWSAATAASVFAFAIAVELASVSMSGEILRYDLGGWPAPYGIELVVDAFSALLLLIITGASSIALLLARNSLELEVAPQRQHLFYTAWLLALAGLIGIVVSGDAFNIFVFMEISSLATYILIAGGPRRQALHAVFKYLLMGTMGATFYLIGVGLIYMMTGTLNLADMADRIAEVSDAKPVLLAAGFIIVGLALKAAVLPLHTWLPNAYTYAPNVATVFIAACSTKVALYVLLRFDFMVLNTNLPGQMVQFSSFLMPLAILAIVLASITALYENNLKRMLAYSSIAQIGYILFGVCLLSLTGLTAGIVHMFNHALAKGALFIAVACVATSCALTLDKMQGIGKQMPLTMAGFVIAGLSLIGIPGTAGFISKWYLVQAALEQGLAGMLLVIPVLLGSLLAVMYIWKVVQVAYFNTPDSAVTHTEAPRWMLAVLWLAIALNLYFGLQPMLPLELAELSAQLLLN